MSVAWQAWALIGASVAAGMAAMLFAAVVCMAVRKWSRRERSSWDPGEIPGARPRWATVFTLRTVFSAFLLGFALAFFAILDRVFSVSVYTWFAALYAALCMLLLLLLLWRAPARHKLLFLGSLAIVVFGMRFVNWNSRKPFLRDLYRIREGMTAVQVDQIMGDYMTGGAVSVGAPETRLDGRLLEQGAQATGKISYRHTHQGWGNSDFGEVTFVQGRVVSVLFLPD